MTGTRRQDVGPFTRRNLVDGEDCLREFHNENGDVVARMRVCGGNTDAFGHDCGRVFEVDQGIITAISSIFIPTQEQWDVWEDPVNDNGEWEDNSHWKAYMASVEAGTPDPAWIPEDLPQEIIDAYHG